DRVQQDGEHQPILGVLGFREAQKRLGCVARRGWCRVVAHRLAIRIPRGRRERQPFVQKSIYDQWAMKLRLLGKRSTEQLLHELRIGLSLRALHHLTHEETQDAFLAGAELRDLVGMPGQGIVDCMLESVTIAELRKSLGRDQRLGILIGPEEARNKALRSGAIEGAGLDEA